MIKKNLLELVLQSKWAIIKSAIIKIIALLMSILIIFSFVNIIMEAKMNYIILLFILLKVFLTYLDVMQSQLISSYVKKELRQIITSKIFSLSASDLQSIPRAHISQVSTEGIEHLDSYYSLYLPQFIYSMLAPVILFLVLSKYSLKISFVLFIAVPMIPISIVLVQKIAKRILSKYWDTYTNLGDSFLENVQGLSSLKIFSADEFKAEEMKKESEIFRKTTMKVLIMQLNSISIMDLVAYGGTMIALVLTTQDFYHGQLDLKAALLFVLLASEFFLPMRRLGSYFHIAMNGIAASDKIEELLSFNTYTPLPLKEATKEATIELKNVSFSYERFHLRDINLSLRPYGFIGVLGESGSGKSTLAKLISAWFPVGSGTATIMQEDLYNKDLSDALCYLGSEAFIINASLRDNINLSQAYSDQEIERLLKKLQLSHLDLDYQIEERAVNLSGGERQRIALLRAILLDADFYIFDEFTSSLDAKSEKIVMDIVKELQLKGKSIFMISHQVHNLSEADELIVLDQGAIVERGTPSDLYKSKGIYYSMHEKQKEYLDFLSEVKNNEEN